MRIDELRELARFLSIQIAWKDAAGEMRSLSAEALKAAVKVRLPDGVDPSEALPMRKRALDERLVEPVTVVWGDSPLCIPLRLPQGSAAVDLDWTLKLEDGAIRSGRAPLGKTFALDEALPHGYHVLQLAAGGRSAETFVIAAPVKAPPLGRRDWGVFLPLYAARAARNWGAGDLTDLQACRGWVNELGGGVVATLPLLAAFEDEPSPYSPVSRLFWNEMYLDPTRLPEWRVTDLHQNELLYLQNAQFVDYPRVIAEKRRVLEAMARRFTFDEEFQLFARRGAYGYAHFRAAQEEKDSANYHLYVQYRMSQQMREAADGARQSGAGLYLDFPLGVNPAGYDAWKYTRSFAKGVSVGSPPDLFFTKGQNWGFPPPDPDAIRDQRHDYFRACIRHHVSHAGVLRIDHVMGLHRLFWIPEGAEARDGFYVRYPDEELYAIVVLEASRQACSVVGEDLGTVPDYVPRMMKRHGVGRMYVVQYEVKPDNPAPLADPVRESVASINTHDMPTFAGFWGGKDIDDRLELGLLARQGASEERERRAQIRDSVMNLLKARGLLQDEGGDKRAIMEAILRFLARSPAELVLVNLEDLWLETEPQNVPGVPERSWKRKLRLSLEQLQKDPEVDRILRGVNEERKESMAVRRRKGSGQTPPPAAPEVPSAPEKKSVKRAVKAVVEKVRSTPKSLLTDQDIYLFNEGSHHNLWDKLGSHLMERDGVRGVHFAVWAPNAEQVSVIGDFNEWNPRSHQLGLRGSSGIWEGFIPGVHKGTVYKYHIISKHNGYRVDKADPFAVHHETPPRTGSMVWDLDYEWHDQEWMANRKSRNAVDAPMTKYEVHLGSWRRVTEEDGSHRPMSYREIAEPLAQYARKMNFTHVELMPVMEHPFYGSWGYQVTGFFAPTSRFGTPQDFKYLVDVLHQNGVGVILDWVPSHFPTDEHGLAYFDGTHLYEHADPRLGFHPDWGSLIFNYGRNEVRSFLLSSALYWLGEYHADGLRFDAVASMLYLDYSRKQGEWIPNEFGGRENIDAISFLRRMNEDVYKVHPDVQTIAEESTAWPMVSRPTYVGGLGFGMKWDMGWMHDTLRYFANDPIHRRFHHNELTFRMMYAYTENFVLPLSHDEVVHGKGSLIRKMPGDEWQKFANLRLLFAHMYAQPGKKLIFMGGEFGQWREWNHDSGLDWHLLDHLPHAALQRWVEDLNHTVKETPALYELDMSPDGFDWIDCCDTDQSVMSFVRRSKSRPNEQIVVVLNFTPVPRHNYQVGLPLKGRWTEILNSDATIYGGSGQGNMGVVDAMPVPLHGRRWSAPLTLPPLGAVFLKSEVVVEEMGVDTA